MKIFFKTTWFERRLFAGLLCLALIPLTIACAMFFLDSRRNLLNSADNALTAAAGQKGDNLESYFAKCFTDLDVQARNRKNIRLLHKLRDAFRQSGRPLNEFIRGYLWLEITEPMLRDIQSFLIAYDYHDLLMLDRQGNILFSVIGENDLGANLFSGPLLAETSFSRTGLRVLADGQALFSDYEFYQSSGGKISGFLIQEMISAEGEQLGLLALQITHDPIAAILEDSAGLGKSGETILIGMDGILRSNTRFSNKPTALRKRVNSTVRQAIAQIKQSGIAEKTLRIPRPELQPRPFLGKIIHLTGLEDIGVSWALLSRVAEDEIYAPAHALFHKTILLFAVTTLLIILTARMLAARMVLPVTGLNRWIKQVAAGDLEHREKLSAYGEFRELADNFGRLQKILRENRNNNELQNWYKDGEAALNKILRGDQQVSEVAAQAISFVAAYVGAQVGILFVRDRGLLVKKAGYAHKTGGTGNNEFLFGEGMVGQAALGQKTIIFKNVPETHIDLRVDSGLGESRPATIVVVPLLYNDQVQGVIELGNCKGFGRREIIFLENAAKIIAIALHTARTRTLNQALLEKKERPDET